jgi:hypothetical protein
MRKETGDRIQEPGEKTAGVLFFWLLTPDYWLLHP